MNNDWQYFRFLVWRPTDDEPENYDRVKAGITRGDLARLDGGCRGMVRLLVNDGDVVRVKIENILELEPFNF